jgi:hypothetical protein
MISFGTLEYSAFGLGLFTTEHDMLSSSISQLTTILLILPLSNNPVLEMVLHGSKFTRLRHAPSQKQPPCVNHPRRHFFRGLEVVDETKILGIAAFLRMRRYLTLDSRLRASAQELSKDGWLLSRGQYG